MWKHRGQSGTHLICGDETAEGGGDGQREKGINNIIWGGVCRLDPWALGLFELSVCWWLGREWYFL